MKLTPPPQRIIVKLKGNFNNKKNVGGTEMLVNTTYNPQHHIRIEAEVVGVPFRIQSNPLTQVYAGTPAPVNRADAPIRSLYHSNPDWIFTEENVFDVREGDKIYFHYNAISFVDNFTQSNRDSFLGADKHGYEYHQLNIDMVHCIVRDGMIKMMNGKALVEQLKEETIEINLIDGGTVKGVVGENGLIESIGEKSKYLEGILTHLGETIRSEERSDVSVGDQIMYRKNSEFKNCIEGIEYYIMRQWDIIGVFNGLSYKPVGKYVNIVPIENENFAIPEGSKIRTDKGRIVSKGAECVGNYKVGDEVFYNSMSKRLVKYDKTTTFVREEDIFFKQL